MLNSSIVGDPSLSLFLRLIYTIQFVAFDPKCKNI